MRYQIKRSPRTHQYYWTLIAANNRKIATSGEGYHNLSDCLASIRLVATSAGANIEMPDGKVAPVLPDTPSVQEGEQA